MAKSIESNLEKAQGLMLRVSTVHVEIMEAALGVSPIEDIKI